jgi:hypothetical protein
MGIGVGSESTFPDWAALAYRGGGGGGGWWMRHTIQELVLASMHEFEQLFIALFPSPLQPLHEKCSDNWRVGPAVRLHDKRVPPSLGKCPQNLPLFPYAHIKHARTRTRTRTNTLRSTHVLTRPPRPSISSQRRASNNWSVGPALGMDARTQARTHTDTHTPAAEMDRLEPEAEVEPAEALPCTPALALARASVRARACVCCAVASRRGRERRVQT